MEKILELKSCTKDYPGVRALDNVTFHVNKGEILALCGENGAGKSTLIKSISGAINLSSGEILFEGKRINGLSTRKIIDEGISVIYQELNLFPNLKVYENIFFGREIRRHRVLDRKYMIEKSRIYFKELGVDINPNKKLGDLSVAYQQIVEIVKSIARKSKLIIMDEPSSALAENEVEMMLELTKKLNKKGISIIYISHKLDEVLYLADRIIIFRDGKFISSLAKENATKNEIIKLMVGRNLNEIFPEKKKIKGEKKFECKNLNTEMLKNINFDLYDGEVLGFGGLVGSGRTELMRAIFGADKIKSGIMEKDGKKLKINSPEDAIENGIALVPEDRKGQGLILNKSIFFNTILPNLNEFTGAFDFLKKDCALKKSYKFKNDVNVKMSDFNQKVNSLSGGNQQKVVLAKWLMKNCDILILDEPTRGIDVGAKQEIYKIINTLSGLGKSIIVVSSEMPELIGISDRILVMNEGKISGELKGNQMNQENIMELASIGEGGKNET